jgi:hypothetical protein
MKSLLRVASLLVLSLACVAPAGARSPEDTLVAFVAAVKKEGLTASVRFIHSAELAAFRAEFEPEVVKRIKSSQTRERFVMFTDPYNPKQIRPFKDDAEFVAVFIKWLATSGMAGITTFEDTTVTPLGTISEGELRHVVARFSQTPPKADGAAATPAPSPDGAVAVTTMKMEAGQPMLLLLPELRNFANMVRANR